MLIGHFRHLKLHAHAYIADRLGHSQHAIAWFKPDALVNPPVLHQHVPGLRLVLLRRVRVHIRHLTACTSLSNVQDNGRIASLRGNSDRLPAIFVPRCIGIAFDENIRPETTHINGQVVGCFETRVELVDTAFVADENGHQIWKTGRRGSS